MTNQQDAALLPVTEALKRCPRCGNRAFLADLPGGAKEVWCVTDRCLRLPPRETAAEAIAAWNTRAEQPKPSGESAGEVERVARALCQHALGRKQQCPCAVSGKFACSNEYPGHQARAAIAALSERGAVGEEVAIPRALFDFLMGCGEIDGSSFSDLHESLPGRFWWRALLRTCDRAALSSIRSGAGDDLGASGGKG